LTDGWEDQPYPCEQPDTEDFNRFHNLHVLSFLLCY
jgi:hypothetical protein